MTGPADLLLLRPLWLLVLPGALGLAWWAARRRDALGPWQRILDPALVPVLRRLGHLDEARRDPAPWLLGGAAFLLALGLAGPASRNPDAPAFHNLDTIVLLLDLSDSVTQSGGLDDATAAASRLVAGHGTRPVALIVFAAESYLVSIPTTETEGLQTALGAIDATTMPDAGSRPERALTLARTTLTDAAADRADVVLISDGAGVGPDVFSEVDLLAAAGTRVSTVFVAPEDPPYAAPAPDPVGLETLAETGGGVAVEASRADRLIALWDREVGVSAGDARAGLLRADHGRWLLLPAGIALLPLFRRRRRR